MCVLVWTFENHSLEITHQLLIHCPPNQSVFRLVTPRNKLEASKLLLQGLGGLLSHDEGLDGPPLPQRHPSIAKTRVHEPGLVKGPSIELEGEGRRFMVQLPAHARQERHAAEDATPRRLVAFPRLAAGRRPALVRGVSAEMGIPGDVFVVVRRERPRVGVGREGTAVEARSALDGGRVPAWEVPVDADLADVEEELVDA